jgi:hypothetical protein
VTAASLTTTAVTAWGLAGVCLLALAGIVLAAAASRYPLITVVEPEAVDDRPAHHASNETAADHNHRPRHTGELPRVDPDVYNARAWHLDEATGPINITGEFRVMAEREVPVMGQDPLIAAEPVPSVPDWFSPERMRVSA